MSQPTTFTEVASILGGKYCMKPIVVESVLRDLDEHPARAARKLSRMSFDEAVGLLFDRLWAMPLQVLEDAPWS